MKIKDTIYLLGLGALLTLSTGCASILGGGGTKAVKMTSSPSGVNFTIIDEKGEIIHKGHTPQLVNLKTGKSFGTKKYTVAFHRDGHPSREEILKSRLNHWYWGNIIFGGLIGMLIVDPATGAMWTLPEEFEVDLASTPAITGDHQSLQHIRVVSKDEIPTHLLDSLVALN